MFPSGALTEAVTSLYKASLPLIIQSGMPFALKMLSIVPLCIASKTFNKCAAVNYFSDMMAKREYLEDGAI